MEQAKRARGEEERGATQGADIRLFFKNNLTPSVSVPVGLTSREVDSTLLGYIRVQYTAA